MKFQVTFKTPDALKECAYAAAEEEVEENFGLSEEEFDDDDLVCHHANELTKELVQFAEKWVKWEEFVTIEFDTEKGTATLLEVKT